LRIFLNSLYALEIGKTSNRIIKSAFELRICSECGFYPEINVCEYCGEELKDKNVIFNIFEGVSYCENCVTERNDYCVMPVAVSKAISHITDSDISRFISFRISENDEEILSRCAERFLLSRAERGFKTLSFYKHCDELP
jgi:DNA repair protein RecO (recombination protein O)